MSEQGDSRPRRALPPRDEDPAAGSPDAPVTGGRRAASGSRAAEPAAQQRIPEPAKPPSGRGGDSPGRRFAEPGSPATGSERAAAPAAGAGRRRIVVAVVSLIVLALLVGGAWLAQRAGVLGGPTPTSTPTPTIDPVATYLAQPEDLAGLASGTTWTVVDTLTKIEPTSPQAKCLLPAAEQQQTPADAMLRTFSAAAAGTGAVLHQVNRYDSPEAAATAFDALTAQLGNCDRSTVLARNGLAITGLSDEAAGQVLVVQDATSEYHTIALSRTGARVNIMDATHTEAPVGGEAVAGVLSAVGVRQCTDGGTCPAQVAVTEGAPLPSTPAGWLSAVDLPRITTGSGSWRATEVADAVTLPGTKCEAIDLAGMPGATRKQQRTYLLRDDTNAPQNFGVDEALYTFGSAEEAQAAFAKLAQNMDACASRAATAQVTRTGDPSGSGAAAAWVVVQKVDQASTTARFRSAAHVSGAHLVYLVANPSESFDFSDDSWHGVAARAGQRLAELA
ncbi:hypothetical protein G7070_13215 [Propioniciclava coleopterorum]|uniref:Uncharacterized protein n=1 Tax=Propioniciclava coleopterorum TaxID=2714937 RepID=A0A6G7Y825_9ACTN|nr:sensor domain-containing protein [Propioniciclava coleopterorum]QIK73044.1 hypothetical protein G7070_13215 [Propioniciclava coleopterorum]